MSNKAITWAYKQRQLGDEPMKAGTKSVLVALADFADQEHSCFPTIAVLADMTSMSPTAVKTAVRKLLEAGLVVREERRRSNGSRVSNRYYLDVDGALPGTDSVPGQEPDSDPLKGRIPPHPQADSVPIEKNPQENPHLNPHSPRADAPGGELLDLEAVSTEPTVDDLFEEFWSIWPRRVARKDARRAFEKALVPAAAMLRTGGVPLTRSVTIADAAAAITTSARWWAHWWFDMERRPSDKIPHAATWLNGERWADSRPDPAQLKDPRRPTRLDRDLDLVDRMAAMDAADQPASPAPKELAR